METTFAIQRRMADWDFAKATTWGELATAHARWIGNYNQQDHQAHRDRPERHRSPIMVLGWVNGRPFAPEELHRIFYRTRFGRTLDRLGYLRFRHWRVYGEHGLARQAVAVWLYEETLTVEYADEALTQYAVRYQSDRTHLAAMALTRRFPTPYRSPQLPLWELSDSEWLKVLRVPEYAPRRQRPQGATPAPLFPLEAGQEASRG